jgi:hypothetical protein
MSSELYKALEGHEMVIAAVLAFLVTLYMILKDKKTTQHVNPGESRGFCLVRVTEMCAVKESHAILSCLSYLNSHQEGQPQGRGCLHHEG